MFKPIRFRNIHDTKAHQFESVGRVPRDNFAVVLEWCTENFGARDLRRDSDRRWSVDRSMIDHGGISIYASFRDEVDATAFRIRWC